MQREYIYIGYFRRVTLLWKPWVAVRSAEILRHLEQAIQSPRGCSTYTVWALNSGAYVTCPERARAVPPRISAQYRAARALCVWTWVPLLFQPCRVTSLPAPPWVRRKNLHMQHVSLGNRKPQELKGRMYTEIKKKKRNEIYFLRHRNLGTRHEHISALLRQLLKILMGLTVQSRHTPVRPPSDTHTADRQLQSSLALLIHVIRLTRYILLVQGKKNIIHIPNSTVIDKTQIFWR